MMRSMRKMLGLTLFESPCARATKGCREETVGKKKSSCDKSQCHNRDGGVSFE